MSARIRVNGEGLDSDSGGHTLGSDEKFRCKALPKHCPELSFGLHSWKFNVLGRMEGAVV